jgi:hypothetical protein
VFTARYGLIPYIAQTHLVIIGENLQYEHHLLLLGRQIVSVLYKGFSSYRALNFDFFLDDCI